MRSHRLSTTQGRDQGCCDKGTHRAIQLSWDLRKAVQGEPKRAGHPRRSILARTGSDESLWRVGETAQVWLGQRVPWEGLGGVV